MAVTLAFHFPAGRYHATPWGHHVNEGVIEWPPSPWRLLRALVSVGYTSGLWNGERLPPVACRLIEKLATELPRYRLPSAAGAHSRHYMPTAVLDKGREKTTLVFDTWGRIGDQELTVTWDVDFNEEELVMFANLVERLGYLGRSESWVAGRVVPQGDATPESNCYPEQQEVSPGLGWEQVTMLAAVDASDFGQLANRTPRRGMGQPASPRGEETVGETTARRPSEGCRAFSCGSTRLLTEGYQLATPIRLEPTAGQPGVSSIGGEPAPSG